jgi:ribosomal protein S6
LKKYETIFILDDKKFEDGANSFIGILEPILVELSGEIVEINDMGHRHLAHPIGKNATGNYINIVINLAKDKVVELKKKFRLDPSVLRVEIFSYDRPD